VTRRPASALLAATAAAAAPAIGLWYQLFRRPLPKTRGTLTVSGLEGPATIARDRFGVPRIEAGSDVDLCFAQGFCLGQDRLAQLELTRRAAAGRIAELSGDEGVAIDRAMRTLGLRRSAEREAAALGGRERAYLEAYAAGVNAAVERAATPPFELQLLRLRPEPWEPADSLSIGRLIALGFSTNMESELFRAELVRLVGADKAARLEPLYPRGNPVVVEPGAPWSGDGLALAAQLARVREAIGLSAEPAGSNNWAVSGERSATGAPLLAGDPHITTSIPDVWYAIELRAPGLELRGGAMPGLPGIVIGQGPGVAWSFTNVMADVEDLYVERIREPAGGGPAEYEFEGEWRPVEVRLEEIRVRGRSDPERLEVRETHHGPIVTDALGATGDEPLALAWTALREPFYSTLSIDAGRMTSGAELVEGLRAYTVPPVNTVWADAGGNIGYKLAGRLPVRRGGCPDLPKPGWTGEFEWDGYVPYEELPEIVNPPGGAIVTANNQIAADGYPHHITSDYLDGYRAARIEELLGEKGRHSLDDFERIQSDVYSMPGDVTAARLARLRPRDDLQARAIERLERWDRRLDPDTVAGTIYQAFTVHLARLTSEAAIGDAHHAERWRSKSLLGFTEMIASPWRFQARLLELWEEGDAELVGGRQWDELALDALSEALDELRSRFGADMDGWTWGRVHGVKFQHPMGQGDSRISRALDRLLSRRLPAGGSQETVSQIGFVPHEGDYTGHWAPSYRLLCDLADPARSRWQHMTGQSGHPGSEHYDDLLDDWLAGRSNPVAQPAVETLELRPA
jgi:penicillin amidase